VIPDPKDAAEPDKDKEKKSSNDFEERKKNQDPSLTMALRDNSLCIRNVAHVLGKSRPCSSGDNCRYKHVLPDAANLKNSDYAGYIAVSDHLSRISDPSGPKDTKLNWGKPNGGGTIPSVNGGTLIPSLAMPTITSDAEDSQPQTYGEATATAAGAADETPLVTAPVIGMHNLITILKPSPMAWKYTQQ